MNYYLPATKKECKELMKEAFLDLMEDRLPKLVEKGTRKKYLTTEEVMELLGCSRKYLYDMRKAGKLAFSREGKRIFYEAEEIDAFIKRQKVEPLEADHAK